MKAITDADVTGITEHECELCHEEFTTEIVGTNGVFVTGVIDKDGCKVCAACVLAEGMEDLLPELWDEVNSDPLESE